jgi:hypothetical protein
VALILNNIFLTSACSALDLDHILPKRANPEGKLLTFLWQRTTRIVCKSLFVSFGGFYAYRSSGVPFRRNYRIGLHR